LALFIFIADLPLEVLCLTPLMDKDKPTKSVKPRNDAGVKFRYRVLYTYPTTYGPFRENDPYYVFWDLRADACLPVFGPLPQPHRRPFFDVYTNYEEYRRLQVWGMYYLLPQVEVTSFLLRYTRR